MIMSLNILVMGRYISPLKLEICKCDYACELICRMNEFYCV